jgi:hypothetical protein
MSDTNVWIAEGGVGQFDDPKNWSLGHVPDGMKYPNDNIVVRRKEPENQT